MSIPALGNDASQTAKDVVRDAVSDVTVVDTVANNLGIVAALLVVLYALAFVCAIREIMSSRTAQGSIAWLLSLAFLPYVTVPLYFIFGWRSFTDYAIVQTKLGRSERARRAKELRISDEAETRDWPVLAKVSNMPFLAGNACDLLVDGDAAFRSMLDGIRAANHTVFFQFFTIADDQIGTEAADALIERAEAGVEVYVLYDEIGCKSLPHSYLNRLRQAAVHVSGFNETHRFLRMMGPMRLNYRNHRKLVVVDYEHAWVGGHNVADQYLGRSERFGHWRDTHVKVSGPVAVACAVSFSEDWLWASGKEIDLPEVTRIAKPGDEPVLVMPTGPADVLEECAIAFAEAAGRARKRLWITSPYFVPSIDIQTALFAAAMRGVDVRILLPEKADHLTVWLASHAHADVMVDRGVKVYRYQKGFLHQKVTLVDDELASIGTVNFDNRSFRINFEITLWFTHERMISKVAEMLEQDFVNARQTQPDDLDKRSYGFRVLAQGAQLLSPIL
ncbi:cardiolipin synthase [Roseibium hamelinense]|uniref:Cardiolipin synthase n=1 Tax=Roseibium hamelinense TaxID=150831 RepID=A0A562THL7_9HYPH|nr:cardiolipin synthase [Roseibium hamelinense]MTI46063.1 cardiolipin synthase [Roseibium hamelinense]TWI92744.1 cardiolipin synthase [Roseibium hamelinense]